MFWYRKVYWREGDKLARAAGFDAGFAFNLNLETIRKNGQSGAIMKAINTWETARMAGAFSPEQKLRMENIKNEYHLEPDEEGAWKLYPYQVTRYAHGQKVRQPGEPLFTTFEFNNPYESQPMLFLMTLHPGDNGNASTAEMISLEVNNIIKLKYR